MSSEDRDSDARALEAEVSAAAQSAESAVAAALSKRDEAPDGAKRSRPSDRSQKAHSDDRSSGMPDASEPSAEHTQRQLAFSAGDRRTGPPDESTTDPDGAVGSERSKAVNRLAADFGLAEPPRRSSRRPGRGKGTSKPAGRSPSQASARAESRSRDSSNWDPLDLAISEASAIEAAARRKAATGDATELTPSEP